MPVFEFLCPHCSSPLRMKDRTFVGRTIECPDCKSSLAIRQTSTGSIVGELVSPHPEAEPASASSLGPRVSHRIKDWTSSSLRPVGVAWIAAVVVTGGLITWMFLPRDTNESASTPNSVQETTKEGLPHPLVEGTPTKEQPLDHQLSPVEQKLVGLFENLSTSQSETGAWPTGTAGAPSLTPDERFSWMAVLVAQNNLDGPQPRWDRAWNHRANERFVRQRQDGLLNPAIVEQTGTDGYPATHFVGVSGIGPDAARLPAGHARAGVFGDERSMTLEDISDGQANTMLVAGVESDLGSWAAAGRSTMRSFTAEPYVRGPDGFGTGQQDGMFVLMADGSTRFLSANTDPRLIRRMAAAADGLPLDENIPGEPGDSTDPDGKLVEHEAKTDEPDQLNIEKVEELVADLAQPVDEPLEDQPAADEPPVDLDVMMSQSIARFAQEKPVPACELLATLEEMLTIKIETSSLTEQARARLDQPVALTLSDTTVGEILDTVLKEVRLMSITGDNRVQIVEQESVTK